jgi:hypothetical protein
VHAHTTGQDRRAAGMGPGDAARKFLAWLAASANPALTASVQAWLWRPACSIPVRSPAPGAPAGAGLPSPPGTAVRPRQERAEPVLLPACPDR